MNADTKFTDKQAAYQPAARKTPKAHPVPPGFRVPSPSAPSRDLPAEIRRAAAGQWVNVLRTAGVALGEGEFKGSEYWCLNPLRTDARPGSFSINTGTGFYCDFASDDKGDGFDLVRAATGCGFPDAVERLARACGIPFEERRRKDRKPSGCTLAEYAAAKGFDHELLTEVFGLADSKFAGAAAIRMPYLSADGSETGARFRVANTGDKFRWTHGTLARKQTYGLPQAAALPNQQLLVVEGESNVHAAAHHALRSLGVPGKTLVGPALGKAVGALAGVAEVIILVDPDAAGVFDLAVLQSLRPDNFHGPIRAVLMQEAIGVKDLADLHKKHAGAPEAFAADWAKVLAAATEVKISTPEEPLSGGSAASGEEPQISREPGTVRLGDRDPITGKLVLSAKQTLPTAEAYITDFHAHPDGATLIAHAAEFKSWEGNRWVATDDGGIRARLAPWLHDALRYVVNRKTEQPELVPFESNPGSVNGALETLRAHAHLKAETTPPAWLDGRDGPDPRHLFVHPGGALVTATGETIAPTPMLFTTSATDYEYDPKAPPPSAWRAFIEQIFPDDESQDLLQEWFGYCLTPDTSQHKILLIVGPPRSGKGTIARVLAKLIGEGNRCSPTTSTLAGAFGLHPLVGKSVAIIGDARFNGPDVAVVTERLLTITGEDAVSIERKFLPSVTMKLPTRFVILSNELPRMSDASGALASRFVLLRLTKSFLGSEDHDLTDKLLAELPGILNWALAGLRRLRSRGRFQQPAAGAAALAAMADLASPVAAFVRDRCELGAEYRVPVDVLYQAWRKWCEDEGREHPGTKQTFGRDLSAAFPAVVTRRNRSENIRFYDGVRLAPGGVL